MFLWQYLDEFSKALASEVRMLLSEVGKLREERRILQLSVVSTTGSLISLIISSSELGYLMSIKSKYGPGGDFDPDWSVLEAPVQ